MVQSLKNKTNKSPASCAEEQQEWAVQLFLSDLGAWGRPRWAFVRTGSAAGGSTASSASLLWLFVDTLQVHTVVTYSEVNTNVWKLTQKQRFHKSLRWLLTESPVWKEKAWEDLRAVCCSCVRPTPVFLHKLHGCALHAAPLVLQGQQLVACKAKTR